MAERKEESFTEKMDISTVSTSTYVTLVNLCAGTDLVVAAVGKSGIGKTAIPRQIAESRNAPYEFIDGPTANVEDFGIPTTAQDTRKYFDLRVSRKFQKMNDFVAKLREENGGEFPAGRNPILSLEEINRTSDKHVTRALFTILNERLLGDIHLDPAIQMVVTLNPTGGGMIVNAFEKDPAMRRRIQWYGVAANYGDFMRYAKKAKFHEQVVAHLEAQPQHFYDDGAVLAGKVFSCPATWEKVSTMCYQLDAASTPIAGPAGRALISGAIGLTATQAFAEFVEDASVVITPKEILQHYSKNSTVRKRFQKLVEDSRLDRVSTLCTAVAIKIYEDTSKRVETIGKQLGLFMSDMPEEVTLAFIREISEQSKNSSGGQQYMLALNSLMAKEKDGYFREAVERLQRAQLKGQEEADKSGL